MKRKDFIKFLGDNNCYLHREGAAHSIYKNFENGFKTAVPRHNELKNSTCKEICKQLEIPSPF
ncbi:MAG: type II toxin-antitoxin system HicA family toxin [Candidatus Kapabacteria bacterium]|nr:type II toxin-antitoxin system HicA family toxin [Candidatus Kapabacteria bacterium]